MLASGSPTFPPASSSLWVFLRDAQAVGIRLASAERQQRSSAPLPSPAANVGDVVSDFAGDESAVSIQQPCCFQMYRGENTNLENISKSCSNSQHRSLKSV